MDRDYVYQNSPRNWGTIAFGLIFAILAVIGLQSDEYWNGGVVFLIATLCCVFLFIKNPRSGMILSDTQVTFSPETRPMTVDLNEVDHFVLMSKMYSDIADIVLKNGSRHRLHGSNHPRLDEFEAVLQARGIKVLRA